MPALGHTLWQSACLVHSTYGISTALTPYRSGCRRLRIQAYRYHVTCGFPAAEPWEAAIGHAVLAGLWTLLGWKCFSLASWAVSTATVLLGR